MEMETIMTGVSFCLQILAWLGGGLYVAASDERLARFGERSCVGSLFGLGAMTVTAAAMGFACALTSGLTLGVVLSGLLVKVAREIGADTESGYASAL